MNSQLDRKEETVAEHNCLLDEDYDFHPRGDVHDGSLECYVCNVCDLTYSAWEWHETFGSDD